METNFNFESAICTSREQSERLLALGLKKETADMYLQSVLNDEWSPFVPIAFPYSDRPEEIVAVDVVNAIPAWSLHRLLCMLPRYVRKEYTDYRRKYIAALDLIIDEDLCIGYKEGVDEPCYDEIFYVKDIYTSLCDCIEWLIKEGYFNKEYLV